MRSHPASTGFILATIALDALSFAILIPVMPDLVMQIGHLRHAQASLWLGVIFAVFAAMQFLCAPLAGALSDRYGRRPVLLVSMAALAVNSLFWVWVPSLWWLLALRVVAGALAGNVSAATAYIADVTPPEGRARAFGLVGAMFGLGFVAGPALGGWLGSVWLRLPFLVSAGLIACNFLYGWLVLPESLPPERRRPVSWRSANPVGTLTLFAANGWTLRLGLAWCAGWVALGAQQSSFILANQMRFGWNIAENGFVLAFGGISQALVQGVLIGPISRRFGPRWTAVAGYVFAIAGYLAYGFAFRAWVMGPAIIVLALGALANPAIQSMLSAAAGPTRQGEVQGGLASLQGLSMMVGPIVMGTTFELTTRPGAALHFAGAPFVLAALVCLGGLVAILSLPEPDRIRATAGPAAPDEAMQPG